MKNIVVGTAGHIDHGKSALVQALTGIDPDRLKEEKARGITIDLGFANYKKDDLTVAFIDVPGHEAFVRNMVAGVAGIDAVLLVIAANESVMPQTREHLDICRLLGVKKGLIVLTKTDLSDQETVGLVKLETQELLAGTFLESAPVLLTSSHRGEGLEELKSVLETFASEQSKCRKSELTRCPIDRVFSVKGYGTVVTGTLLSGSMATGDQVEVLPLGRMSKVRGVQVHGSNQGAATAGQRVAVNLAGIEVADLGRGAVLSNKSCFVGTRMFDGEFKLLKTARSLKNGSRIVCHSGTASVIGRLSVSYDLSSKSDDVDLKHFSPLKCLEPGMGAFIRIRLEEPLVLARGDRFIVRSYSPQYTIGGGVVLDPLPPRGRFRGEIGFQRMKEQHSDKSRSDVVVSLVSESRSWGLPRTVLGKRFGLPAEIIDRTIEELELAGRLISLGNRVVTKACAEKFQELILKRVTDFHRLNPSKLGLAKEEIRDQFSRMGSVVLFDYVIERLSKNKTLAVTKYLALASHAMSFSDEIELECKKIEAAFQGYGLEPPRVQDLAGRFDLGKDLVSDLCAVLLEKKVLVSSGDFFFHRDVLETLIDDLKTFKKDAGAEVRLDIADFKSKFNLTRKHAIPLLTYLDRKRITRRVGDVRILV